MSQATFSAWSGNEQLFHRAFHEPRLSVAAQNFPVMVRSKLRGGWRVKKSLP
jgi:hypothetical protein